MTNTSTTNLLKAYRLAITKKETTIADLLEKIIISEIHSNNTVFFEPLEPPSIVTGTTYTESSMKVTDDVLHTT